MRSRNSMAGRSEMMFHRMLPLVQYQLGGFFSSIPAQWRWRSHIWSIVDIMNGSQLAPASRMMKRISGRRSKTPDMISWAAENGPPVATSVWPMIQVATSFGDLILPGALDTPPCRVMGMPSSISSA